ncbi:hypothetical protein [Coleofasciculus sp. FACHB-SPT36]|nr:hypothetical protein [Coleofasciculus sp. FACHB-SPT36]MBD2539270.1 hypothetical protein [Coleofasciculus sp. FACHB-SPT36]
MKKLCKIAQLTGALPRRRGGKSSAKVTSSNPMEPVFNPPMSNGVG